MLFDAPNPKISPHSLPHNTQTDDKLYVVVARLSRHVSTALIDNDFVTPLRVSEYVTHEQGDDHFDPTEIPWVAYLSRFRDGGPHAREAVCVLSVSPRHLRRLLARLRRQGRSRSRMMTAGGRPRGAWLRPFGPARRRSIIQAWPLPLGRPHSEGTGI